MIVVSHTFGKGMKYVYGLYMNAKKNVYMVTNLTQELVAENDMSAYLLHFTNNHFLQAQPSFRFPQSHCAPIWNIPKCVDFEVFFQ